MLPRAQRLVSSAEIRRVIRRGHKVPHPLVICYAVPAENPRAAVVVSKSVGNAPVRNRVRRRLRHILAEVLPTLSADIVVRALPPSADAPWVELREATLSGLAGIRAAR